MEQADIGLGQPQMGSGARRLPPDHLLQLGDGLLVHRQRRLVLGVGSGGFRRDDAEGQGGVHIPLERQETLPVRLGKDRSRPVIEHPGAQHHQHRHRGQADASGKGDESGTPRLVIGGQLPEATRAGGQNGNHHHATGYVPDEIDEAMGGTRGQTGRDGPYAHPHTLRARTGQAGDAPVATQPDTCHEQPQPRRA